MNESVKPMALHYLNGENGYRERSMSVKELAKKGAGTLLSDGESTFWKGEAFVTWGKDRGIQNILQAMTDFAQINDDFAESLELRVPLAAPDEPMINQVDAESANSLTPGVKTMKGLLDDLHVHTEIVSGGWIQTMQKIRAKLTGIQISANTLMKGNNGKFDRYDNQNPLAQKAGKEGFVSEEKNRFKPPIFVLGDGKPDMQISAADIRILFTQHSGSRPVKIEELADVVAENFAVTLPLILGEERWHLAKNNRDPRVRKLFREGAIAILAGQGIKFNNYEYGCEILNRLSRFMDLRIDENTAPIQSRPNLIYSYSQEEYAGY